MDGIAVSGKVWGRVGDTGLKRGYRVTAVKMKFLSGKEEFYWEG